jgi:flagellar M-ring protein FliF
VRAQVVADVDFTVVESTTESYQPDDRAVRSEETFEESTTSGMAAGVPGALTNQPPPAGTLDGDPAEGERPAPVNSTRRATRNYELDRSISHTRNLPGAVKQLSVAVLVDYRTQADDKGKSVRVPMDDDEIARITDLVKEAVGFSEERNDSIKVSNIPFRTVAEVSEAFPETPIWQQPWVGGVVKQVIGGVFLLVLLFGVLRPVLRNLALRPEPVAGAGAPGALPPGTAGNAQALGEDRLSLSGQQMPVSPEQQFGMARSMIDNDPRRVAGVVKDWVATDG